MSSILFFFNRTTFVIMFRREMKDKRSQENPSGAMADIAFLLLIFFLITTTILQDSGILVRLPPWSDEAVPVSSTNVFNIMINANNELLVNGYSAEISELKEQLKTFITNPDQRAGLPESPKQAIVSILNDRGTLYKTYLEVYDEIIATYKELRNEYALQKWGYPFDQLDAEKRIFIRQEIPMIISEAEPTDLAVK